MSVNGKFFDSNDCKSWIKSKKKYSTNPEGPGRFWFEGGREEHTYKAWAGAGWGPGSVTPESEFGKIQATKEGSFLLF